MKILNKSQIRNCLLIFVLFNMCCALAYAIDKKSIQILESDDLAIPTEDSYNEETSCTGKITEKCIPKHLLFKSTCEFNDTLGICECNCVVDFDPPDPKPKTLKCSSSCTYVKEICHEITYALRSDDKKEDCHTPARLCKKLMNGDEPRELPEETQYCVKNPQSTPVPERPGSF